MGLIEGIVGKFHDLIVDGLGRSLRHAVGNAAGDILSRVTIHEDLSLRLDDLHFLFGNGAADIICLAHGIAAQLLENGNHLLLVDDTAVGDLQNRLQMGCLVTDLAGVLLAGDKLRDGIHGAGAIQRHDCRHIFDGGGLHIDAHAGNAGRLQLENALGLALSQHGKGLRVIIRHLIDGEIRVKGTDLLLRILDHRQVSQAQEVHFQQAQLLNGGHGVLGDDGIIVAGQGHIAAHRVSGDHHAGGMGRGVAGHALQLHGGINELAHPLIIFILFPQLGRHFQRLLQGNMQGGGHQLGHHIGFGIGEIQRTAHIPDGATGCHGAKGGDLRHMVGTVFAHHILNHLAPAFLAEVGIEVGHADAFRVQKPLEDQRILHGIHFCDMHAVGHDGCCTRATARTDRDPLFLGIADEIPYDEVVVYITHPADDTDLVFQPLHIAFRRVGVPLPEAVITQLAEVFLIGVALRHRERGQMVLIEHKFQIAHIGNLLGVGESLVAVGEQLAQLFLALEVKFLCLEFHAVFFVHGLAGLDAQQHILHVGIFLAQIVGVIGDHQGQARFPCHAHHALVHRHLLLDAMILQFQIEMLRAEDPCHAQSIGLGSLIIFSHQVLGHAAGQAGRGGNQTLMVLFQQLQIHSGLAVKTIGKGLRHQQAQILITLAVPAQQHQMIGVIVQAVDPVCHAAACHIHLTADNGLDACSLGGLIKIDTAIHDAMIRNGNGSLAQLLDPVHHAANAAGTVQQAELGMDMKMYKTHTVASFASSSSFLSRWFMAGLEMGGSIMAANSVKDASGLASRALAASRILPGNLSSLSSSRRTRMAASCS